MRKHQLPLAAAALALVAAASTARALPGFKSPGVVSVFVTLETFDNQQNTSRKVWLIEGQRVDSNGSRPSNVRVQCGSEVNTVNFAQTGYASLPAFNTLMSAVLQNDALILPPCPGAFAPYPVQRVALTVFKVPGDVTATNTLTYTRGLSCDPRVDALDNAVSTFLGSLFSGTPCDF